MIGRVDDAFEAIVRMPNDLSNSSLTGNPSWLFTPYAASFRADPRFMRLADKWGLVAIWKATKWPDFCTASDAPYDCRAVAAKLTR